MRITGKQRFGCSAARAWNASGRLIAALAIGALFTLLASGPAVAAYTQRFSTITTGAITFTGNTIGLSKLTNANAQGTNGSIGTFITTNTALQDLIPAPPNGSTPYPLGTTNDWTKDSAAAQLNLPAGSTVLYAELIWSGSYSYGSEYVLPSLGNSVTFITPAGTSSVAPAAATAQTLGTSNSNGTCTSSTVPCFYVRSANVTSLVQAGGAGTYTVGGIPSTEGNSEDNSNTGGWTLAVVYQNASLPARDLTVFVGAELTNSSTSTAQTVTGFCTPPTGAVSGRLMVSALEGDSAITGDQMQFGPTAATLTAISGPNNAISNFFASQINNDAGLLDTTGTFGTRNHPVGSAATGARQGYDITNVDVSARLTNGQTAAVAKGTSTGDQYVINALALQINVGAPGFPSIVKTVDKATTFVGDTLTYTITLDNSTGTADATGTVFNDVIPPGTTFVPNSFTLAGVVQTGANPATGVAVGTIAAGTKKVVTYQVTVTSIPAAPALAQYSTTANFTYQYISCSGQAASSGAVTTNAPLTTIARLKETKTVAPTGTVLAGQTLTYSIAVSNDGLAPTTAATLQDGIPAGTTYVANSTTLNGVAVADNAGAMPYAAAKAINSAGRLAGQINPGETATVSFKVQINAGQTGTITNTALADVDGAGAAPPTSAQVTNTSVAPDLVMTKTHSGTFYQGQSSAQYTLSVNNKGGGATNGTVTVTDTLPAGLAPVSAAGTGWVCTLSGQVATCTTSSTIAAAASAPPITLTASVATSAAASLTNSATVSGGGEGPATLADNTAADVTTVLANASLSKAFSPAAVNAGTPSTLTITLTNPNSAALTGAALTDNLPSGLSVAAPANATTTCGGTVATTATSLALAGGTIAANGSCTLSANVIGAAAGGYTNTLPAGALATSNGGTNQAPATAVLGITAADLVLAKSHVGTFYQGQSNVQYTLTASNAGNGPTAGVITVTDTLPAGLTPLSATGSGWSCSVSGQTVTCTTSAVIAAAGSAAAVTLTANVAANAAANLTNTATVSGGGEPAASAGNNSASDPTTVLASPTLTKAFAPAAINVGGTAVLTLTLGNSSGIAVTGASFTDTLPAGVALAAPLSAATTCSGSLTDAGGAALAVGSTSVRLTGGVIPASGTCAVSVSVTAPSAGSYPNSVPAGGLATANAGASVTAASATLLVNAPDLTLAKSHAGTFYQGQSNVQYTLTASNSGSGATTSTVTVTDTLPAGLTPVGAVGSGWSCSVSGQTVACSTSAIIAASGSAPPITLTANVAANAPASLANSAAVSGGGEPAANTGNNSASDPTTVLASPGVAKAFAPATINANGTSTLTITLSNANGVALTGIAITDNFPAGLSLATPANAATTCGGSLSTSATSIALASGTILASGSCTLSVSVTAAVTGSYANTIPAGGLSTANGGPSVAAASATLTVNSPDLTLAKSHAGTFYQGQSNVQYSLIASNVGNGSTGGTVNVVDTLPTGLTPVNATGSGWSCAVSGQTVTCGSNALIAPGASAPAITLTANVAANAAASVINAASVSGGGEPAANTGNNSASDPTTVLASPTVAKAFAPGTISVSTPATLTVTLTNSNSVALTGVTFSDSFPLGVTLASPANAASTCGGTVSTTATSVALAGGTLPANGSCTVSANVTAVAAGSYQNTIPAGGLSTANAGANQAAANATLAVNAPDLQLAKSHVGAFYQGQSNVAYSLSASNSGSSATQGSVSVVDTLPSGLTPVSAAGTGWSCGVSGQTVTCSSTTAIAAGAAAPAITLLANVAGNASPSLTNSATVSGGGEPAANTGNNSASDPTTVLASPGVTKAFAPATINLNGTSTLTITLANANAVALTGAALTDNLPSGVSVATPANAATTCGGGVSTTASSVTLAGGTIPAGSSCTLRVDVTASAAGSYANTIPPGGLTTANAGGSVAPASATLAVSSPDLRLSKSHAGTFYQGENNVQYLLTVSNAGSGGSGGTVSVVDTLPAGLTPVSATGTGWACGISGQTVTCTTNNVIGAATSAAPITLTANVTPSAAASLTNTATVSGGGEPLATTGDNSASDPTTVLASPGVAKAFSPATINANGTSTLTITLSNANAVALTGSALTDNLPAGLAVASPANAATTCGGSVSSTAGSVALAGGTIPANGSCTLTVNVTATATGSYQNTIAAGALATTNGGSNQAAATAALSVSAPDLQLAKSHAGTFYQGQNNVTYTLTASNTGSGPTVGSVSVTDTVPAGLVPVGASGTGWSCGISGQTVTCSSNSVIAVSASGAPITLTANVAPNAPASLTNTATVSGGGEPAANSANNSASDPTTVLASPVVAKAFAPGSVTTGATSSLTITLSNPNGIAVTGAGVTDNFPAGIVLANPLTAATSCGGALTDGSGGALASGGTSMRLSGGSIPANGSCTITANVTAAASGSYANTIAAGALTSANAGSSTVPASATLTVSSADLVLSKSHVGTFYRGQGGVSYTLGVSNVGTAASAGAVNVADTLPAGLTPSAASGSGWSCAVSGQTVSCSSSAAIAAGAAAPAITLTADVASGAPTSLTNTATVSGGGEPAANAGNNSASDPTQILANPTLAKSFAPTSVNINGTSQAVITLSNPNAVAVTGATVTDTFPAGMTLATPLTASTSCGGALTDASGAALAAGAGSVRLNGGTIPANGSCAITVNVTASAAGSYSNTIAAGALSSANAGSNTAAASATLGVAAPDLVIAKTHSGSFFQGQSGAAYTLTVSNTGSGASAGTVTVSDTLPAGLTPTLASGSGWSCGIAAQTLTCTRSDALLAGTSYPSITLSVNVAASAPASLTNTATVAGGGEPAANTANNSASDLTTVLANPTLAKAFAPTTIIVNATATLSITLGNANAAALTSAALTDNLPGGLVVASPANATTSCGGAVTTTANSVSLAGGTIPANGSCTVSVNVTTAAAGSYANTIAAGALSTANGGVNATPASATLTVAAPDLVVAKSHAGSFYQGQSGAQFTITVSNVGTGSTAGAAVNVADALPAGLTATGIAGTNWTCVLGTLSCTRADPLAGGASYEPVTVTVSVAANAPATVSNTASVSGGNEPAVNTGNNSVSDAVQILAHPSLTKAFAPATINVNGTSQLTVTLTNPNAMAATGAAVTDTFPAGLTLASPLTAATSCAGTLTDGGGGALAAGAGSIRLAGGTIPASGACTITANVTAAATGSYANTIATGALTTANAGVNASPASATVTVNSPDLVISKTHVGQFYQGQSGAQYILTVSNIGTGATTGAALNVLDTPSPGLTATALSGSGWTCVVATLSCTRSDTLAAGAAYPPITLTVTIDPAAPATISNSASVSGGGEPPSNTGNDSAIDVAQIYVNPTLAKSFAPAGINAGATSTLAITLGNANGVGLTGAGFTDTLPAGVTIASPANATTSCGGSVSTTANSVSLAGGTIPANGSCAVTVATTSATAGSYVNTISAGALSTTNGGKNAASASATLTVSSPDLVITKSHLGNFFQGQNGATYTLTVTNIGAAATSGTVTVTDSAPAGLTAPSAAGGGWSCGTAGQTVTCTRSDALAVGSSYPAITLTVNVANNASSLTNTATVSGGGESAAFTGNNSASDTTTVLTPLQIAKAFSPAAIAAGGVTTLTFTLTNSNSSAINNVTLTDLLPAGVVVATPLNTVQVNCGGVEFRDATDAALAAGATSVRLRNADVPANGTCTASVKVTAPAPGSYTNTLNPADVSQPSSSLPTSATLTVNAPALTLGKSHSGNFYRGQVGASYSLLVGNGGAASTSGTITVTDTLPAGLTPTAATSSGVWTCGISGQIVTCTASSPIAVGATAPAITVTVSVAANAAASLTNTASVTGGGDTGTHVASDVTTVLLNPIAVKSFAAPSIVNGATTTATVVIDNLNAVPMTGVAFTDTLPTSPGAMTVAGTPAASQCGGTVSVLPASAGIQLSGATVPANGSCSVSFDVTASASGSYANTIPSGGVTSANAGTSQSAASASLNVAGADLVLSKSHVGTFYRGQGGVSYTLGVSNVGTAASAGAVNVADTLPAGLTPSAASGSGWSCAVSGQTVSCSSSAAIAAGAAAPAITLTADVASGAPTSLTNTATVSGGGEPAANAGNNSASDPTQILANPTLAKSFAPTSVNINGTSQAVITLSNPNAVAVTGATVTDTFPAGMTLATPLTASTSCGGALTDASGAALAAGAGSVRLSGGTIPANGSCAITVNVTASAAGSYSNTIAAGALSSANAGSNTAAASATLGVAAPDLVIAKTHSGSFFQGQSGAAYTLTVSNTGSGASAGTVTVSDTLPAGLTPTLASGSGWSCGIAAQTLTCTRSDALLAGTSYPSITLSVNVAASAPASLTNTATVAGGGEPAANTANNSASDLTTVLANPTLAKAFAPGAMSVGGTSQLRLTLGNGNSDALTAAAFTDSFPAGLTVAAPLTTSNNCGGSLTDAGGSALAAGAGSIRLTGGTIPAAGTCLVTVTVTAAAAGAYPNTIPAGALSTTNGGSNPTATSASLSVAAPDLTVGVSHAGNFYQGETGAVFQLVANNIGSGATVGSLGITYTLPAGLTPTAASGTGWSCGIAGATVTCSTTNVLAVGATSSPITVTVNVAANAPATLTASATIAGGGEPAGNFGNNTGTDVVAVLASPTAAKGFAPAGININGTSQLTLTLTNSNAVAASGVAVTDTFPAGLTLASPLTAATSCAGTLTDAGGGALAAGAGSIRLAGGTIPANGACTITANVTAGVAGSYANTVAAGALTTVNMGASQSAISATLTVNAPDLVIAKTHSGSFYQGQSGASYSIVVSNVDVGATAGVVTMTDTVPAGLTPTAAAGSGWSCGIAAQTVTCSRADSLGGGLAYPAITLTVDVAASAPPSVTNLATVAGGGEPVAKAGNNSASDLTQLFTGPQVAKAFAPAAINVNGTSTLTITLSNPNATAMTAAALTDNFPAGMVTAAPLTAASSCGGGLTNASGGALAAGATAVRLSGGTIPGNGSCTITVVVTVTAAGSYANTLLAGALTTANAGSNAQPASATLTAASADLTLAKSHAGSFYQGQTNVAYTLAVSNIGSGTTVGTVNVTDTLPAGLAPVSAGGSGWSCSISAQTVTCSSSAAIAQGVTAPTITLLANVAANAAASLTNTASVSGGGEPAANAGNNNASDPTTVLASPVLTKSFVAPTVGIGASSQLILQLTNTNGVALSGAALTDNFPAGLVVATPLVAATNCGGAMTDAGGGALAAGAGSIRLAGGTIPAAGNCTVTVNVSAAAPGSYANTIVAGGLTTANAGASATPASATLLVSGPDLVLSKTHAGSFFQGQTGATYSLTATNQGAGATLGTVTVTDTLPSGLTPTGASGTGWACSVTPPTVSCSSSTPIAAGGVAPVITLTVNVAANAAGTVTNAATVSGGGEPASASGNNSASDPTQVLVAPGVTKAFNPAAVNVAAVSALTITLSNPNGVAVSGAALTDTLPAGLAVATPANATSSCGGAITSTANSVSLTGATLAASASCTISVNVSAAAAGTYVNTIAAGALTTANAGSSTQPASATLTVASPDLTLSKSHSGSFYQGQSGAAYLLTVANGGSGASSGPITVTDTLPAGLTPVSASGAGWSCATSAQTVTCSTASAVPPASTAPPITLLANVAAGAPASLTNTASVSGGGEPPANTGNNNASDPTAVLVAPGIAKSFAPAAIRRTDTATLTLTLTNGNSLALTGAAFTDTFPAGVLVATPANASTTCGGTLATGASSVALSGGSIPASGSCAVKVDVSANATGSFVNLLPAGALSTSNGGASLAATSATLSVIEADLALTKTHSGSFNVGVQGSYTLTVTNVGSAPTVGTVTVTDVLPTGLSYRGASGNGWTCTATGQSVTCTNGAAIAAGGAAAPIVLNVVPGAGGNVTNRAQVGGGGEPAVDCTATPNSNNCASDTVAVTNAANLSITIDDGVTNAPAGGTVTYTIVVANAGPSPADGAVFRDPPANGLSVTGITCTGATGSAACPAATALTPTALQGAGIAIPALPAGSLVTFAVTGTVTAAGNTLTNAVSVAAPAAVTDPDLSNNTAADTDSITAAAIDVVLAAGTVTQLDATTFDIPYTLVVANLGAIPDPAVQVSDYLPTAFASGAPTLSIVSAPAVSAGVCTVSSKFDGAANPALLSGADALPPGGSCTLGFTVRVHYPDTASIPAAAQLSSAYASVAVSASNGGYTFPGGTPTAPAGALATDASSSGSNPPSTANGDTPAPTPVTLVRQRVDITKLRGVVTTVTPTRFRVPFTLVVRNTGAVTAGNVQINDFVGPGTGAAFPGASSVTVASAPRLSGTTCPTSGAAPFTVNPGFNGTSDTALLGGSGSLAPDASCTIDFTVEVAFATQQNSTFGNTAYASALAAPNAPGYTFPGGVATPPAGAIATDPSTDVTANPSTPPTAGDTPSPTSIPLSSIASLSGSVWLDSVPNRIRDSGESGVAGFAVEISDAGTGQAVSCVAGVNTSVGCIDVVDAVSGASRSDFRTDTNGNYAASGLIAGTYLVRFRDGANGVSYATPANTTNDPSSVVDASGDALRVVLNGGANVLGQSLPLDPSGVIYDSTSRDPLAGARVTFCGPAGAFSAATPLTTALTGSGYAPVAGAPNCVSMLTGSQGFYQFLLNSSAPAGQYQLSAAEANYTAPSVPLPPAPGALTPPAGSGPYYVQSQPNAPPQGASTTYYLLLNLGAGAREVLHNHIPLDRYGNGQLALVKTGSQIAVEVGESLQYQLRVSAFNGNAIAVVITDRLPAGFRFIPGTLRVRSVAAADPAGAPGPLLSIKVGDLASGETALVTYRVRVGVGAQQGDGTNRATARSLAGQQSNEARYRVRVDGGVFTTEACVVGKIFVDCNGNQVQDPEELGIPGVRLYFSNGTYLISDVEGKYSYCGLTPTTHTLKVDSTTLPKGSRLVTSSNRNALDPNSLFLDLKDGELHRADFIEGSCSNQVLGQVKARRAHGEVDAPETERKKGPALIFELRPPGSPRQATDSADQVVPRPRVSDPGPPPDCSTGTRCWSSDAPIAAPMRREDPQ